MDAGRRPSPGAASGGDAEDINELKSAPGFGAAVSSVRALIKRRLSHDYVPDSMESPIGLEAQSDLIKEQLERALSMGPDAVESFLILGPRGSGKSYCLDHAIRSVNARHKAAGQEPPLKKIYVHGLLANTDAMAVAEMARQLQVASMPGKGKRRKREPWEHFQFIIEGLRNGFAEKTLYVLVVDHIETFASPIRQMLLYTLFDLHHRSDIKFIVLGLSDNLDLWSLLEKRVKSRISNKSILFFRQSLDNVIKIMDQLMDVPCQGSTVKQRYVTAFRKRWQRLSSHAEFVRALQAAQERGQCVRWFVNLAFLMATELSDDQPFFTLAGFRQATGSLAGNRTSTSKNLFQSLSGLELAVLIALKRLVDKGVVPCQTEAIWREYEALVRQHPDMPYKYSRDVLNKGLSIVLSLGLVSAYNKNKKACLGGSAAGADTMSNLELQSMVAKDSLEAVPLTINFHPKDLEDFLSSGQDAPTILKIHFVHGDLRRANIIVKRDGQGVAGSLLLIDLDWSGRAGIDRYPVRPNPLLGPGERQRRPEAVQMGAVMQLQHDLDTIQACFGELWPASRSEETV